MASVNKVILVGNLGADPEVRYLADGGAVANISMATTDKWKDKSGEQQERTEWHRVAFFGKLAEIAAEYLKKGGSVYIEGRIQTNKYEKDGETRYSTSIIADRMQMLGARASSADEQPATRQPAAAGGKPPPARKGGGASFDDMDDDIPF